MKVRTYDRKMLQILGALDPHRSASREFVLLSIPMSLLCPFPGADPAIKQPFAWKLESVELGFFFPSDAKVIPVHEII